MKRLVVVAFLLLTASACGAAATDELASPSTEPVETTTTSEVTTTTATTLFDSAKPWADPSLERSEQVDLLAASELSRMEKADELIRSIARPVKDRGQHLGFATDDQLLILADEYRSGRWEAVAADGNDGYAMDVMWLAWIYAEGGYEYYGDGHAGSNFAYDFYQIVRDVYRGVESVDSEFVTANRAQIEAALAEAGL